MALVTLRIEIYWPRSGVSQHWLFFLLQFWADQEGRKALSKNNAKGLATLKQKCKKYLRDCKFEDKINDFKQVEIFFLLTH